MGLHRRRSSSIFLGEVSLRGLAFSRQPSYKEPKHRERLYVVTPSPPAAHTLDSTLHAYCIDKDKTYARLSARLDRMLSYKATVSYQLKEYGRASGLEPVETHLEASVEKLEKTLDDMMEKILEERKGGGGGGAVFKVGGKWVREL